MSNFFLPLLLFCSQLDNNNFNGSTIPSSYANMTKLLKMYVHFFFSMLIILKGCNINRVTEKSL